jgi:hemolysin III
VSLYEVLHAINHWSFEKWAPLIEHPTWGRFWRPVYSFHLRHHAVIDCNESVSGFFGLPVADWVFGTCLIPQTIYADGEEWKPENFVAPRPRGLIRWLDAYAHRTVEERRAVQRATPVVEEVPVRIYSRGEEIANWLTHGIGAVLSVVALTLLIVVASTRGDAWHVVSFTVFGLSLLVLYTASTLYHLSRNEGRRRLLRRIDQAAIFLLIAGSYTPFLLTNLRGPWGWTLFGIIWGLAILGILHKTILGFRFPRLSTVMYLGMGWLAVIGAGPLMRILPPSGLAWLVAGGLFYTAGVIFYHRDHLPYRHAWWHVMVMAGSVCHFTAVLRYATG